MNNQKPDQKKSTAFLWFVSIVASFGGLLFGYDAVVVSGTITQVEAQFALTAAQKGFYVSCVLWACMIGTIPAGMIADKFGRKNTLLFSATLLLISAAWSGIAPNLNQLITARMIGGIGIGAATMICPLYISEISPEKYRGRMVTLFQLTITIGIIICVFTNWAIFNYADKNANAALVDWKKFYLITENWRSMYMAEAIPGILFLITGFFVPKSPRWLIKENRTKEALTILEYFNSKTRATEISTEIQETLQEEKSIAFNEFMRVLKQPLLIAILVCFFSEACGASVVFYYGPQIFEDAGFALGDSLGGFATIAIINFIATLFALRFIDTAGRRKLITVGIIGSLLSHLIIWALFETGQTGWPIVIGINLFVAFFACALGPVKYVFVSEIFPTKARGLAIAISTFTIWLASAAVNFFFPILQDTISTGWIFFVFAIELAIFLPIVRFMMPETKGRTIEEIEKSWMSK